MSNILVNKLREKNGCLIHVPTESLQMFQQLIHRGANLWPDAPAEIKEFADVITNGYAMQDYFGNPHLAGKGKPLNADKE